MVRADMELAVSGISERVLKAGDQVPECRLPDACGGYVRLNGLWAKVLSFGCRGTVCALRRNKALCRGAFIHAGSRRRGAPFASTYSFVCKCSPARFRLEERCVGRG